MTAIGVAVIVGVCGMLTPDGDTKKYVRFAGALCLICAIAAPLASGISEWEPQLEELISSEEIKEKYDEIYKNEIKEGAKSNAETLIRNSVLKQFDLPDGSLEVILELSDDGSSYSIKSAHVILKHSAVFADPRKISEYVNSELGCPCLVVYE